MMINNNPYNIPEPKLNKPNAHQNIRHVNGLQQGQLAFRNAPIMQNNQLQPNFVLRPPHTPGNRSVDQKFVNHHSMIRTVNLDIERDKRSFSKQSVSLPQECLALLEQKLQQILRRLDYHQQRINLLGQDKSANSNSSTEVQTTNSSSSCCINTLSQRVSEITDQLDKAKQEWQNWKTEIIKSVRLLLEQKDAKITEVYHEIDKNFRKHVSESFGEVDKTLTDLNQRSSSLAEQFNNLRQICLSQSEQENVNKKEHTLMSTIKSDLMDLKERMNRLEKPKESFINLESLTVSAFKSVNQVRTIHYEEYLKAASKGGCKHTVAMAERVYHVDTEGYLLDENSYYLLNKEGQLIRITETQKELLQTYRLLL